MYDLGLGIMSRTSGFSFIELLVSLVVLSLLAAVCLPYGKVAYTRAQEVKLQRSLREIRIAIDRFFEDCKAQKIMEGQEGVSPNCYPSSLTFLVEGVKSGDADGKLHFYLRKIPVDPFASVDDEPVDHWDIRGYTDEPDGRWNGDDVFDIRVTHERTALNGTQYYDW